MIAKEDAYILLEGLNYLTENPNETEWEGTSRKSFLFSLSQIFLTDNIEFIRKDLEKISGGQINPNTTPQDVLERAANQGITKENLEVRVQEQRSQVNYWTNRIKANISKRKSVKTQTKATEVSTKTEKETKQQAQAQIKQEKTAPVQTQQKQKETPVVVKETQTEKVLIPVTGGKGIEKEIPVGQKLENIQIKFDVNEMGSVEGRLNATQPFYIASVKSQQSEFIDLNPSLNLISKGVGSEQLKNTSGSLPEGPEKQSLFRISYTMQQIERIFPDEISRMKNFLSVNNVEVQISNINFDPTPNNLLLSPNVNSFGGYTVSDGFSGIDTIAGFAKNQILDKASDAVLSKVETGVGKNLAKGFLGKTVSSIGSKFASSAIGKTVGAIGAKIGAVLGNIIPIPVIGALIGAIIGAISSWIVEKFLPLLKKIKNGAKNVAKGAVATASAIILFPFILFVSSITLPLLIVLIALPISIAIIMFIINSGAYIVPPKISTLIGTDSPYIEITKTANPVGPFKNGDLPLTVEYTVEIKAKKSGFTNIQIIDNCTVTKKNSSPACPALDSGTKIPSGDEIPDSITTSESFSFKYKRTYTSPTFIDSLVIDTISVVADVPEQKGVQSSSSAIVKIGNPPEQCPSGWPVSGGHFLSQGPGGSYSHSSIQAVDIAMPAGTSVLSTHSGIVTIDNDPKGGYAHGDTIIIKVSSMCNGIQYQTWYAHMTDSNFSNGSQVTKGQTIGKSGWDHLHYEFRGLPMNVPYIPKSVPANCYHCMKTD